jgi:hypothetical protein
VAMEVDNKAVLVRRGDARELGVFVSDPNPGKCFHWLSCSGTKLQDDSLLVV